MSREYTAVFKKKGEYFVAWVEEIPGVNTQGSTLPEARENLREALHLVLEENKKFTKKSYPQARREPLRIARA